MMAEKLLIFGIGYVLGTRAGRERFDELIDMARKFAQRDEVKMAINIGIGFLEERSGGLLRAA